MFARVACKGNLSEPYKNLFSRLNSRSHRKILVETKLKFNVKDKIDIN
jgi:hypothetical protein